MGLAASSPASATATVPAFRPGGEEAPRRSSAGGGAARASPLSKNRAPVGVDEAQLAQKITRALLPMFFTMTVRKKKRGVRRRERGEGRRFKTARGPLPGREVR